MLIVTNKSNSLSTAHYPLLTAAGPLPTAHCPLPTAHRRKGVILLVVITLLALFAVVGLAFVYYSQAEYDASKLAREAQTITQYDADTEQMLSYILSQLLYDVEDKVWPGANHNVYSALRGHGLGRNMYGYNLNSLNTTPYNGSGRPTTVNEPDVLDIGPPPAQITIDKLPNHQYFPGDGNYFGKPDFIRDPGRYGSSNRNATSAVPPPPPVITHFTQLDPVNSYTGENPSWTIADLHNMYLGRMDSSGNVTQQSYWRNWTGISGLAGDPNWNPWKAVEPDPTKKPKPHMKYATLRPLPWFNRGDPAVAMDPALNPIPTSKVSGFPAPADGFGDVRNVEAAPNNQNDSIWIDLGFPVQRGPDGKLFKPLVAFFITDLDDRVNVNAAGNLRLYDGTVLDHGSNKGLAPSEINLKHVLPFKTTVAGVDYYKWQNALFYRYGADGVPGRVTTGPPTTATLEKNELLPGNGNMPPFYGMFDYDGAKNDPTKTTQRAQSEPMTLPTGTLRFPTLPTGDKTTTAGTYRSGDDLERIDHPWLNNYFFPNYVPPGRTVAADDRSFVISNMEGLLRYGGTNSPALTSDLFLALKDNLLDNSGDPTKKRWRWLTTHSCDLARPGLTPWLTYDAMTGSDYSLTGTDNYPKGGTPAVNPTPNKGEFGGDARGAALVASARRLFLRGYQDPADSPGVYSPIWDYPELESDGSYDYTKTQVVMVKGVAVNKTHSQMLADALKARQTLAKDIFNRLRLLTTGARPTDKIDDTKTEYSALRWLAQLAVNIVDFIDIDDNMTPFQWNPWKTTDYVVGTELPRLTINEIYAEIRQHPDDDAGMMITKDYKVNFWVELINPLMKEPNETPPEKRHTARMQVRDNNASGAAKGWAGYKLTILNVPSDATLKDPANVSGDPAVAAIKLEVGNWDPTGNSPNDNANVYTVTPLDSATTAADGSNKGFYLLGPQNATFPATGMMPMVPTPTLKVFEQDLTVTVNGMPQTRKSAMSYDYPMAMAPETLPDHTLLLRRLANPALPEQSTDPTKSDFNPYVTVDFADNVKVNDAVEFNAAGMRPSFPGPGKDPGKWTVHTGRTAAGRKQPYAAHYSQRVDQTLATPKTDQPQHSFFSHNSPLDANFDWLVHFDSFLSSPAELLYVGGHHPQALTQLFRYDLGAGMGGLKTHQHIRENTADYYWAKPESRLYRFLEHVDAGYRPQGVSQDGRTPGKININTIDDVEVWRALIDNTTVDANFTTMKANRGSGPSAKPFKSFATPNDGTSGIADTLLRSSGGFFMTSANNQPTEHLALLSKLYNNVTTRSNVFAVWMTVGFFEVYEWPDDPSKVFGPGAIPHQNWASSGIPMHYELGKEIGKDENRHIRHRMFAIVDRTAMVLPETPALVLADAGPGNDVPVAIRRVQLISPNRVEFQLRPGMQFEIGSGGTLETVTIKTANYNVTPAIVTVDFQYLHKAGEGFRVPSAQAIAGPSLPAVADGLGQANVPTVHGNPGPQLRFDHRHSIGLVPYYSIIQ